MLLLLLELLSLPFRLLRLSLFFFPDFALAIDLVPLHIGSGQANGGGVAAKHLKDDGEMSSLNRMA